MPRRFLFIVPIVLVSLVITACSSTVPRLHQPDRVDAFCGDRAAIATAIESIVSSSGDVADQSAVPSNAQIHKIIASSGGIIAHWDDQPLYQPSLAKALGVSGNFVTLGDAAISNAPAVNGSRPMYLTLKTAAGPKTFALRAFDVQDVCNQGKLSS